MWIRRPNVLDRRLLGALIRLEKPLSPTTGLKEVERGLVTVGALLHQQQGRESVQGPVEEVSKLIVRELLPRAAHLLPCVELIVLGRCSLVVG